MKKILYLSIFATGILALGACDHEPDFPGLEEESQITNVQEYVADYQGSAFTSANPAKSVLPAWLQDKYYTCDKGSKAMVNYKYINDVPEYVLAVSDATVYTLTAGDYTEVWGEGSSINYFSPSKPAATYLPGILGNAIEAPAENALLAVNYNQANEDGSQPAFSDDFETNTLDKWENVTVTGSYKWQTKEFSKNHYIQNSAYNHKAGALESWLVTAAPVSVKSGMVLSMDVLQANYVDAGGRLSVLISTDLAGFTKEDIGNANWEDVTSELGEFAKSSSGSGDMVPVQDLALDKYAGKKIYVAMKYVGDSETGATTTVRIDNIAVKDAEQQPVAYKNVTALYKYAEPTWKLYTDVTALQPSDYEAMGEDFLTSGTAGTYIPVYLSLTYPYATSGTIKAVAYKLSDTKYAAAEFQKAATGWESTSAAVEMTDEYEYNGSEWVYVRTVPKAVLNMTFDDRKVTDNDKTMIEGWLNITLEGGSFWLDKSYSGNNYIQCSAYGSTVTGLLDAWMITPALEIKSNYILNFDMVSAYWMHEALHVYVSSNFSGEDNAEALKSATWTEITENFTFPKNETGYSKFTDVGSYKMDSYVGQTVYIAFQYLGDKTKNETSTVQLDNIYVGE